MQAVVFSGRSKRRIKTRGCPPEKTVRFSTLSKALALKVVKLSEARLGFRIRDEKQSRVRELGIIGRHGKKRGDTKRAKGWATVRSQMLNNRRTDSLSKVKRNRRPFDGRKTKQLLGTV